MSFKQKKKKEKWKIRRKTPLKPSLFFTFKPSSACHFLPRRYLLTHSFTHSIIHFLVAFCFYFLLFFDDFSSFFQNVLHVVFSSRLIFIFLFQFSCAFSSAFHLLLSFSFFHQKRLALF